MLTSDTEEDRAQAIRCFDSGVQDTGNVFGRVEKVLMDSFEYSYRDCFFDVQMELFMVKQNEQCALDIADQILVSHPDFSPALLVKMKLFMSLRDWERTEALAQRCVCVTLSLSVNRWF